MVFRHIYNMGRKSSTQRERFLRLQIDNVWMSDCSAFDFFNHQIKEKLPQNATEIPSFLKTYENWTLLKIIDEFFEKTWIFFKILNGDKFAVEILWNDIIAYKSLFFTWFLVFSEIRKFSNLENL